MLMYKLFLPVIKLENHGIQTSASTWSEYDSLLACIFFGWQTACSSETESECKHM